MKLKNITLSLAAGAVVLAGASQVDAALARFVSVGKAGDTDTRFHLSELQVFTGSTSPDGAGAAIHNGGNLSTNFTPGVPYGPGITTSLEHGGEGLTGGDRVINGATEGGGAVWSTQNGLTTPNPIYTLDLGSVQDVTRVEISARNDGCCANRWRNLEITLWDDNGGAPGNVVASVQDLPQSPNDLKGYDFAPIPEPSALALLGLSGLAFLRRRR